jgi:hypothetical protein
MDGESVLDKFTNDLTSAARRGQLDPLVGRDGELRRLCHILLRRTKNNPVLVGEPGVCYITYVAPCVTAQQDVRQIDALQHRSSSSLGVLSSLQAM